eukprot:c24856_g1_i3 orf=595-1341(+)
MTEVFVHVYDVTNSASVKTNAAIVQLNKLLRDGIGLGGVFHSAVEVYDHEEWSFGYCENGSGVFSCSKKGNPMYTYRETVSLGYTNCSSLKVNQILTELSREWPGYSYDLLSRNCNHFCDQFCERLGVQKLPAWVNRFANAGDAAVEAAENTMKRLRQAKSDLISASKVAYRFLFAGPSTSSVDPDLGLLDNGSPNGSGGGLLRFSILKAPVTLISKNCLGFQDQGSVEKSQAENVCNDGNDFRRPSL